MFVIVNGKTYALPEPRTLEALVRFLSPAAPFAVARNQEVIPRGTYDADERGIRSGLASDQPENCREGEDGTATYYFTFLAKGVRGQPPRPPSGYRNR
jgi:thiamine biosynthesis protein ThiS